VVNFLKTMQCGERSWWHLSNWRCRLILVFFKVCCYSLHSEPVVLEFHNSCEKSVDVLCFELVPQLLFTWCELVKV